MALTLRDITWASLSETRSKRDKIAVSVSERRTYLPKVSAIGRAAGFGADVLNLVGVCKMPSDSRPANKHWNNDQQPTTNDHNFETRG